MSENESAIDAAADEDGASAVAPQEARRLVDAGEVKLLDVRTEHEWDAGHVPGAQHVLLNDLAQVAAEFGPDQPLLVYCRAGNRSAFAAEGLRSAGLDARAVEGGALAWQEADLAFEPADGYVAESGEAAAVLEARERSGSRPSGISW